VDWLFWGLGVISGEVVWVCVLGGCWGLYVGDVVLVVFLFVLLWGWFSVGGYWGYYWFCFFLLLVEVCYGLSGGLVGWCVLVLIGDLCWGICYWSGCLFG